MYKYSVRASRKPQTPLNKLMQLTEIFTVYCVIRNEYTVAVKGGLLVLTKLRRTPYVATTVT